MLVGGHRKIKILQLQKCALWPRPDNREIPKVDMSPLRQGQQDRTMLQGIVGNHPSVVGGVGEGANSPPFPHTLQQGPFSLR